MDDFEVEGLGSATRSAAELSESDLDRWAALIANGAIPFPIDREQRERLAARVFQLRRARLLAYVGRAIGHDIMHETDSGEEKHAPTDF